MILEDVVLTHCESNWQIRRESSNRRPYDTPVPIISDESGVAPSYETSLTDFDADLKALDAAMQSKTQSMTSGWPVAFYKEQEKISRKIARRCALREAEVSDGSSDEAEDKRMERAALHSQSLGPVKTHKYAPAHQRSQYDLGPKPLICYRCGGPGHLARDCDLV